MIKQIKRRFLRRRLNRNLARRDWSQRNNPISTIGFLVDTDCFDDFPFLENLAKKMGVKMNVLQYSAHKSGKPSLTENRFSISDFNWKGEITNPAAVEFLRAPVDALVGIHCHSSIFFHTLISESKAGFKIGFGKSDENLYDLVFHFDPLEKELFEMELEKYLKALKKI